MKFKLMASLGISVFSMHSSLCVAKTISGEIVFDTKPPRAGAVYISNDTSPIVPAPVIDQIDKQFTKSIVAASPNKEVTFKNSDKMDHNIFADDRNTGVKFDSGLMGTGATTTISTEWTKPGITRIGCKIHPKMRSYVAVVPGSQHVLFSFRKSEPPYTFELADVPDNADKLVLSIPDYDLIELDIASGLPASQSIVHKGKEKGRFTAKASN